MSLYFVDTTIPIEQLDEQGIRAAVDTLGAALRTLVPPGVDTHPAVFTLYVEGEPSRSIAVSLAEIGVGVNAGSTATRCDLGPDVARLTATCAVDYR